MAGNAKSEKPIEDIFAETDKGSRQVKRAATPATQQLRRPVQSVATRTQRISTTPLEVQPRPWYLRRSFLLVGLPLVIVAVVAAVIALGPFGIISDWSDQDTQNTRGTGSSGDAVTVVAAAPEIPVVSSERTDTDGDGLSDAEEAAAETDPAQPDTDRDGLSDRDETKVYQTNPRNPDTDGDGNNDGTEVKNGYDPKGDGLLRDLNVAIQELNNS